MNFWCLHFFQNQLCVVMIKTYEVHDPADEDDDEMLEFDPEVVENLNWWQRCFVPRYPVNRCPSEKDDLSESQISTDEHANAVIEEKRVDSRDRFNSEDVTVQTNVTTPPGTPDVKRAVSIPTSASTSSRNNNIPRNASHSSDLETHSIRNMISAIDEEECEDLDKSSDDDNEMDR